MLRVFEIVMLLSCTGGALTLFMLLLKPILKRKYSATWQYYVWFIILVLYIIPLRLNVPYLERILNNFYGAFKSKLNLHQADLKVEGFLPPVIEGTNTSITQPLMEPIRLTSHISIIQYLAVLWTVGVLIFLIYHGYRYIAFRRNIRSSNIPVTESGMLKAFHSCCTKLEVKKKITLMSNPNIGYPMITGFFKPLLILPQVDLTLGELNLIYRHELIHYKRKDLWYKLLALFANAIHWFNPLTYLVVKNINEMCEYSCDAALTKDMDKNARLYYGEIILNLISKSKIKETQLSTGLNKGRKDLERRLENIMDLKKYRNGFFAFLLMLTLSFLTVCISTIVVSSQPETQINLSESQNRSSLITNIDEVSNKIGASTYTESDDYIAAKNLIGTPYETSKKEPPRQKQNDSALDKDLSENVQFTVTSEASAVETKPDGGQQVNIAPPDSASKPDDAALKKSGKMKELIIDPTSIQIKDTIAELSFTIKDENGNEIKNVDFIKSLIWVSSSGSGSLVCDANSSKLFLRDENRFSNNQLTFITCIDQASGNTLTTKLSISSLK